MADNEKEAMENSSHGTDWEVVSPACTYAAAPGPKPFEPTDKSIDKDLSKNEQGFPDTIFMSKHFIFPSGKIEDLPVGPDCIEIHNKLSGQGASLVEEDDNQPKNSHEEGCKSKSDDNGIQFFDDEKGLSVADMEFGKHKRLQRLSLDCDESVVFSAYYGESDISSMILCSEDDENTKHIHSSCQNSDSSNGSERNEENKEDESCLPCEAWWKRKAVVLYNHAKEGNAFWSVFVVAALMGLVIFGKHRQREKSQTRQHKLQLSTNNEVTSWKLGLPSQFKVILGGEHGPLNCGDAVSSL